MSDLDKKNEEKQERSNVIPFPARFAEPVDVPKARPKQPEFFDDDTTVATTGQYEDTRTDE